MTQVIYGDLVVSCSEAVDGWIFIKIPYQKDFTNGDSTFYQGWIQTRFLAQYPKGIKISEWKSKSVILAALDNGLFDDCYSGSDMRVSVHPRIPEGAILPSVGHTVNASQLILPDGKNIWVDRRSIQPILKARDGAFSRRFIRHALKYFGKPYIWGGTAWPGVDCSGLVYCASRAAGLLIPRDTGPQAKLLDVIRYSMLKPGDIYLFSRPSEANYHVAVFLGGQKWVHSGRGGVQYLWMDPFLLNGNGFRRLNICQ